MDSILSSGGSNASGDSIGGISSGGRGCNGGKNNNRLQRVGDTSHGTQSDVNAEVKKVYQQLYIVVKQLDDEKKQISGISQLFQNDLEQKRAQIVQLCIQIIFRDYQSVGKRAREIMWRKGYYEFIAYVKKNWTKELKDTAQPGAKENIQKIERFLCAGILNYKRIAAKMEEIYDLDLKYLIDFSIISDSYLKELKDKEKQSKDDGWLDVDEIHNYAVDKSLDAVSFALDTIHSSLLSLGDLHRYFLDFRIDTKLNITKQLAAKYYFEAFKLNPAIGMAQNQLGTLYYGQNYDLDSIYHYLYSLVSLIPFELSENNVCKLFAAHADYLTKMDPDKIEFSLQDFYARFYLIVDIFFFDKEVPDFNSLCHCVLVDLRKILCSKTFNVNDSSIFKIVSILFFCLSKLKMINSQKVYSLNAFLVAVCSDLMDACIVSLEQTILAKTAENEQFHVMYTKKFEEFDMLVRKSRNEYKNWLSTIGEAERKEKKQTQQLSQKDFSSDSRESQRSHDDYICKTQDSGKPSKDDIKNDGEQNSTRSSDEAKESDLKTPLSCKSKKRGMKLRRRRRKIAQSDDSSCYDTESDMDTDFSTDEEDYTDLSSNFDTDFSDIEAAGEPEPEREVEQVENKHKHNNVCSTASRHGSKESVYTNGSIGPNFSDNEDIVIEEENIIYPDQEQEKLQHLSTSGVRTSSQDIDSEELLKSFEILQLHTNSAALNFKNCDNEENQKNTSGAQKSGEDPTNKASGEPPKKMVYRNKYTKINPNIVVDFAKNEATIRALKILFDWLRINHEILFGCYHSNPEFIHKIMKLLNYCNIDIFTRKVFFEREFLTTPNVRQTLCDLFDVRANVPLSEDFVFKSFDIFQSTQITLDWETTIREKVTPEEECILRIFKMVDFGFFICKQKKFNYRFCVKARRFTENTKKKREEKKSSSRRRERRTAKNAARKRTEGRTRRYSDRKNGIVRKSYTSNEEKDTVEECKRMPRKGYLRNRNTDKSNSNGATAGGATSASTTTNSAICEKIQSSSGADEERSEAMSKKCEIMGKLWLKNEVETLEEELRKNPMNMIMTPFLVVDAKALTEYNGIVKNLVKSRKFIVLIPNAVFNELDELKKRSENARNVIRWLEQEFKHGNRHLRAQRDNENLTLSLIKIPRKLDRDGSVFLQIAQFCNHLVANHSDPNATEFQSNVVTYLSGDSLHEKQRNQNNFSFTGILDSIPVRHDQIANFYAKFKANKK
ncbi:nonsense-mediated mRNA decay factor SMG5 [Stomoxys calcitrans]|uniref:nonsense-mediated mRNA decay factor SMG5 n=1 Tax=Stomoxys calcitrans TaxID=35570 RepID=UPI0027E36B9A|nr:nonsense-mediated mRNA decay factor SMG5 [Stomoxys calcitrans]